MTNWLRSQVRRIGFDVIRYRDRSTFPGLLRHARDRGLNPATVIDVGVGRGTQDLYELFSTSELVLMEPLKEFNHDLNRIEAKYGATIIRAAALDYEGEVRIHVHEALEGSSVHSESEGEHVDGLARTVPATTVDATVARHGLEGPYLLKVDVQGAELEVLRGASQTLENTQYALIESSLFRFFDHGAVLAEVVELMAGRGFALYDIHLGHYRPLDDALAQVDLAFVERDGVLRQSHHYASPAQRRAIEARG